MTLNYEMRFRLDISKKFFTQKGGDTGTGYPISGGVQSQLEWGPVQLNLERSNPAHGRLEQEDLKRSLPT